MEYTVLTKNTISYKPDMHTGDSSFLLLRRIHSELTLYFFVLGGIGAFCPAKRPYPSVSQ